MQLTWVHLQNILTARTTQYQTNKQPCQKRDRIPEKILQRRNTVDQYARRTLIITQFSSVTQLCTTIFTSWTACSTPGFLVHYQHSELAQTHVHRVSEAIQSSHLLLSRSPPTCNFPSIRVLSNESVLRIRGSEYWNFIFSISLSSIQDWFPLGLTGWISLQCKGFSRVFSNTTFQKHQFFSTQLSLQTNSYIHIWLQEKP